MTARVGYILLVLLPFFQIGQPAIAFAILIFVARSFLTSLVGAPWSAPGRDHVQARFACHPLHAPPLVREGQRDDGADDRIRRG